MLSLTLNFQGYALYELDNTLNVVGNARAGAITSTGT